MDGVDVDIAPLLSPQGQYFLLRAGNLFIKHSAARNLVYKVDSECHLINLAWHPVQTIGYASLDTQQIAGSRTICHTVRCHFFQ